VSGTDPVDPTLARLLDDPAVWAEVSPGLRERTLAEALGADTAGAPVSELPRHRAPAPRRRPVWQRPGLLAAAAVVVVGLAVGGSLVLTGDSSPSGVEVALAGTEEAPSASATVTLRDEPSGFSVVLATDGLPPAPEGTFYEAWLVAEGKGKVSAGTFHQRGDEDEVQLWLGVDPAGYDAITVTRQPVDGGTLAEGVVVLRGELPQT